MVVGRDVVRGDALMILTVDDEVPAASLKQMISEAELYDAKYVKL
jgi:D-3-phosphoglycerate dehydrogenase